VGFLFTFQGKVFPLKVKSAGGTKKLRGVVAGFKKERSGAHKNTNPGLTMEHSH